LGFVNGSGGTLYTNVSGAGLNVGAAGGSFLNNGTVKVDLGATLTVTGDASGYVQNQVGTAIPITALVAGIGIAARVTDGTVTSKGTLGASTIAHAYPHL
jgi:hypothetical protein